VDQAIRFGAAVKEGRALNARRPSWQLSGPTDCFDFLDGELIRLAEV
jgi:hypothetical protein